MDPVSIAAVGWGISIAGWLVSPIISELLKKSFSFPGSGPSPRLRELETKVLELKLMLEAVEASPRKNMVEQWMKELKSAFYKAQDILDAIEYHQLESRIIHRTGNDSVASTDGGKSVLSFLRCNTTQGVGTVKAFKVPAELRKKLKATIEEIENLISEGQKLLAPLQSATNSDNVARAPKTTTTTSSAPSAVFGLDGDLQMISLMLRDASSPSIAKCYSVIGIHGIPGSGKTTLAQLVCEHEKEDSHFNPVMWVHVSQNFSVDTILSEMLETASRKMDPLSSTGMLQRELERQLKGKRFFLVLDDVWKGASEHQLDLLLSPLKAGCGGSKILVTTRFADAARDLGAQHLIPICEMDKEQYILMFMHYALAGQKISDQASMVEHECIGRKIAEKLGGSPLAARTVAGQLRRRSDIGFWRRTLNRDLLNCSTMGALWWSYQQLEEPIRQCFTYCSMFTRRYQLERDKLVHLWMAQGFVETTTATEDIEDVGDDYFEELPSCSFIQSIGNSAGGSGIFKIHDLLHDLVDKVAGSDSFRVEKGADDEIPRDVRHLFIESYDKNVFAQQILKLKTLRTLFMSCRSEGMAQEDLDGLLKGLKKLRVLHVHFRNGEKILELPACIGEMKHLRYIFVTGDMIRVILPPAFGKLYHLQKFGAPNCCLGSSSSDEKMSNLINLRYMHTMNMLEFPNVGRLKFLRTLNAFTVRKDAGYEIQQLEHLNSIRGHLIIYGLEAVKSKKEAHQAKLSDKVYVSSLELEWCYSSHESSNLLVENQVDPHPPEEILEALRPPSLLTSLSIRNYRGSTYPSWLSGQQGTLENLQHLCFSNCNGSDAPPKLGEPCVRLRTLSISDCSWNSLPDNMEHLTSLEELNIMSCKNILSLPRLPVSLERLSLTDWNGSDAPPRFDEFLVKLCRLQLHSCSWNSLPENMELLTSLEELAIESCENILSLPSLPPSLKIFQLVGCNPDLTESCQTDGDPNWEKIEHIPEDFKSIH